MWLHIKEDQIAYTRLTSGDGGLLDDGWSSTERRSSTSSERWSSSTSSERWSYWSSSERWSWPFSETSWSSTALDNGSLSDYGSSSLSLEAKSSRTSSMNIEWKYITYSAQATMARRRRMMWNLMVVNRCPLRFLSSFKALATSVKWTDDLQTSL